MGMVFAKQTHEFEIRMSTDTVLSFSTSRPLIFFSTNNEPSQHKERAKLTALPACYNHNVHQDHRWVFVYD